MKPQNQAFTLIELLVVVAIIGILISLLFPAIAAIYNTSLEYQCQSNLGQLAQVIREYAMDFDGKFPLTGQGGTLQSANDWLYTGLDTGEDSIMQGALIRNKLIGKLDILICPVDQANGMMRTTTTATPVVRSSTQLPFFSYVINGAVTYGDHKFTDAPFKDGQKHVRRVDEFKPTDILFIEESDDSDFNNAFMLYSPNASISLIGNYHLTDRHRGGGYFSCMDGHVEWMTRGDFDLELGKLTGSPWYTTTGTRFLPN
jgi:prepilin-type N-terminal cleavage/methylation domain-containing protein